WQRYCVRLPTGCDPPKIIQGMLDDDVSTRRGTVCSHGEPKYPCDNWTFGPAACKCSCGGRTTRQSTLAQDSAIVPPRAIDRTGTGPRVVALRNALAASPTRPVLAPSGGSDPVAS